MITREEYLKAVEIVKQYRDQCIQDLNEIEKTVSDDEFNLRNELITDVGLNNRILCAFQDKHKYLGFKNFNIWTCKVFELENVSERKLEQCRNIGKHSINQIKDLCRRAKIKLLP